MKDKKEIFIGLAILVLLIAAVVGIKMYMDKDTPDENKYKNLTQVYVATGGGKENFIADDDVNKISSIGGSGNRYYSKSSSGLSGGAIAGIVIACVVALAAASIAAIMLRKPAPVDNTTIVDLKTETI